MGLFSMPFRGLIRVFEEIADRVESELWDEGAVKQQLMELYAQLEAGTVSEEAFAEREAELVQKLEDIEEHKKGKVRNAA